jgi:nucleoside 2-deoxyribosyltransferase
MINYRNLDWRVKGLCLIKFDMNDLYLTSTFSKEWNINFNPRIGNALKEKGVVCHLPKKISTHENPSDIFLSDLDGINSSKCIFVIAVNESPNWGAEVGYAYSLKKPIIALTDIDHQIPLICNGMITEVVRVQNLEDINTYIDDLVAIIKKY